MSSKERDARTGARDFSKFFYEVFQLSSVCRGGGGVEGAGGCVHGGVFLKISAILPHQKA